MGLSWVTTRAAAVDCSHPLSPRLAALSLPDQTPHNFLLSPLITPSESLTLRPSLFTTCFAAVPLAVTWGPLCLQHPESHAPTQPGRDAPALPHLSGHPAMHRHRGGCASPTLPPHGVWVSQCRKEPRAVPKTPRGCPTHPALPAPPSGIKPPILLLGVQRCHALGKVRTDSGSTPSAANWEGLG